MKGFWQRLRDHFVPHQNNAYRPHLLRKRALVFLLAVTLLAEGSLVLNLVARHSGYDFLAAVIQSELIGLTNVQRAQNKVGALTEHVLLNRSAQTKAEDMAARGYFAHTGPDGVQPWAWIAAAGYEYQYAGENLAVRFVDSKEVVTAWMAAPTHRANIVKQQYTEVGIGIAQGLYKGQPATFVVQHFGKPSAKALAARTAAQVGAPAQAGPQGAVLGAETGPGPSVGGTMGRELGRLLSEPRASTTWVLGGVSALLLLALAFTFFHHVQIQSRDLLLPGVLVAATALFLLVMNMRVLLPADISTGQPAAAALSGGTVVTPEAASDER